VKILMVGDVVGRPGRHAVRVALPLIREQYAPDFVVVNCENAASGYGITEKTAEELLMAGADCLTGGNHIWANREGVELVGSHPRLLRPANFAPGVPGRGSAAYEAANGVRVGVINLIGRVFMDPADCPFRRGNEELAALPDDAQVVIIDFHAEATSEKQALGYYFDGRVSAVVGTHTHVTTADERILPRGTAYLTDVGMCGPLDTIIGVERDIALGRFLNGLPARFVVPKEAEAGFSAVLVEVRLDKMGAKGIQRVSLTVPEQQAGGK
jgi:2',3'-cyclic-nucleotide 2'-phosphodiesterase